MVALDKECFLQAFGDFSYFRLSNFYFLYSLIIFSLSEFVIGQLSHLYTPHKFEYPPSDKIIILPHFEQWVGLNSGGFFNFSKLYSLVPYQIYISNSCLKSSKHFLQVCHFPLCSSVLW